ncbi:mitochondrial ribosomal protein subunit L20-domain-containing protein [Halteromyces radiatus]|uniref:mitochondrial ribosomal protein subunit L20-domain-containing protein n=1 Tax=Halteromyces radiatus TaxID=101107 RepID=UPI00221F8DB9|nr:mitochondrial ribosomal protein subunit L20-domain-containing protein [Halteromyces radiatus]KAI8082882.1 mitochondrial ribosomal protein subunit L20-domain-containing protein [Halteromyces radiatus]
MFSQCIRQHIRGYATKSKTTNMKMTARVPLEQTSLPSGNLFISRQLPVPLQTQANAPPIHRPYERKPELDQKTIDEIRQLRQQDPETWTRKKLANKYNCSPLFISMIAPTSVKQPTPPVTMSSEKGYRRRLITKNRQRRKELW